MTVVASISLSSSTTAPAAGADATPPPLLRIFLVTALVGTDTSDRAPAATKALRTEVRTRASWEVSGWG